ncbi:hypothetical protein TVAG_149280 [Trichomonas vaginalis G3]|uniref:Right handed beta helix domain-containing protein n=1 Tax=Trichomonas vaginalis (strain ATCC PRA-98 / G3) TaxID=412133 RepID=A2ELJ5_TRIV3|nr:F-box only protein family [Trichomonas vaginalis G3]EAY06442.1 hypothetical protein TVAG_149280 [Trichomonas vaginalis G3]KAI5548030.1 F-box only protein family [Trichomonas vaginalis G3]|eukprot:XP_001318665.1 hypothetical protein [Trichomonas vaginalis G3]
MQTNSGNIGFPGLPPPMGLPLPPDNNGFPPPPQLPTGNLNSGITLLPPPPMPGMPPLPPSATASSSSNYMSSGTLPPFQQVSSGDSGMVLPPFVGLSSGGSNGNLPPFPGPTNTMPPTSPGSGLSSGQLPMINSSSQSGFLLPPLPGQTGSALYQSSSQSLLPSPPATDSKSLNSKEKSEKSEKVDSSDYDYDYSSSESDKKKTTPPKAQNTPPGFPLPPQLSPKEQNTNQTPPIPSFGAAALPPMPQSNDYGQPNSMFKPNPPPFPSGGLPPMPPPPSQELPSKPVQPPFPSGGLPPMPPPTSQDNISKPIPPFSAGGMAPLPSPTSDSSSKPNPPPFSSGRPSATISPSAKQPFASGEGNTRPSLPPFASGIARNTAPLDLGPPPKPTPPPFAYDSRSGQNLPSLPPMPGSAPVTPTADSRFNSPFAALPKNTSSNMNNSQRDPSRKDSLPPFAGLNMMPVENRPRQSESQIVNTSKQSSSSSDEEMQEQEHEDLTNLQSVGIANYTSTFNGPLPLQVNPDQSVPIAPILQQYPRKETSIMSSGKVFNNQPNSKNAKNDDFESVISSFTGITNTILQPPTIGMSQMNYVPRNFTLEQVSGPEGIEIPKTELYVSPYSPMNQTNKIELMPPPDETMIFGFTGPVVRANVLSAAAGQVCAIPGQITSYDNEPPPFYHPFVANVINLPPITPHTPVRGARYSPNMGSIQSFIDQQPPLSIIEIPAGRYNESLFIRKSLFIRGAGVEFYSTGDICLNVSAPEVFIEGIKFVNQPSGKESMVQNCAFIAKSCAFIGGTNAALSFNGKSYATIDHCQFSDAGFGINMMRTSCLSIYSSEIHNMSGPAIYASEQTRLHAENCNIRKVGQGINLSKQAIASIIKCNIQDVKDIGIDLVTNKSDIYIADTKITYCGKAGLYMRQSSRATIAGCEFMGRVAILMELNSRLISFKNKFTGTSAANQMIGIKTKARFYSNDDTFTGTSQFSIVANGYCYLRGSNFTAIEGNAVIVDHGESTFINCLFTSISKTSIRIQNGKIKCYTSRFTKSGGPMLALIKAEGFIKHSSFSACSGSSIMMSFANDLLLEDIEVTGSANCAMELDNSSPKAVDCQFRNNAENGVFVEKNCNPTFEFCVFSENRKNGITIINHCNATFVNCLVNGNESHGLALNSDCTLVSTTFSDNSKYNMQIDGGNITMTLCNFKKSETNIVISSQQANVDMKHCVVQDATDGLVVQEGARISMVQTQAMKFSHACLTVQKGSFATLNGCTFSSTQGPGNVLATYDATINCTGGLVTKSQCGFNISKNSRLNIDGTKICNCTQGIASTSCIVNVMEAEIIENKDGMRLINSSGSVKKCNISGNNGYGIVLEKCNDNVVMEMNSFNINKQDNIQVK